MRVFSYLVLRNHDKNPLISRPLNHERGCDLDILVETSEESNILYNQVCKVLRLFDEAAYNE